MTDGGRVIAAARLERLLDRMPMTGSIDLAPPSREELLALPELAEASRRDLEEVGVLSILFVLLALILFLSFWDWDGWRGSILVPQIVLAEAFIVRTVYKRLRPPLLNRLRKDPRAPVLLLRSFAVDDERAPELIPGMPLYLWFVKDWARVEELVVTPVCSRIGPLIAVGDPKDSSNRLGAHRVYVSDERWKEVVEILIRHAAMVIFVVKGSQLSEHVAMEVAIARRIQPPNRIFVLHFKAGTNTPPASEDVARFHAAMGLTERSLAPSEQAVLRFEHDGARKVHATISAWRAEHPMAVALQKAFEDVGLTGRAKPQWAMLTPIVLIGFVLFLVIVRGC